MTSMAWSKLLRRSTAAELGPEHHLGRDTGAIVSPATTNRFLSAHWGLAAATTLEVLGFGGLALLNFRTGTLRAEFVPETIVWYLLAFAGFMVAVVWNERATIPWRWLVLLPLVFRLILLTTTPTLSDDVYRYLWEGHLVSEGVSPYAYTVTDPALDSYTIPAREFVNNPTLASPYLPAAHGVFGLAALTLPAKPLSMQAVMVLFDLVAAALIVRLLTLANLPRKRVLLYLWNPLVILEVAHGAHLDALMLALVTGALVLTFDPDCHSGRCGRIGRFAGPVLLALAALTRPVPLLLAPVLFWRWSWAQRAIFVSSIAALLLPFALFGNLGLSGQPEGTGLFGSARVYSESFRFNSGIYHWVERSAANLGLDDGRWYAATNLTRLVIGSLAGTALGVVWWRARGVAGETRGLLRFMAAAMAIYVLFTPVLHPWYTLLLLGFLVFVAPGTDEGSSGWFLLAGWGYLTAALIFSYLTYIDPLRFGELESVRQLQWLPTFALIVFGVIRFGGERRAAVDGVPRPPSGP